MNEDLDAFTQAQLRDEFVKLADQLSCVDNRRRKCLALIAQRQATASAQAKVAALSPLERDALKVALDQP